MGANPEPRQAPANNATRRISAPGLVVRLMYSTSLSNDDDDDDDDDADEDSFYRPYSLKDRPHR
jgi:hypothetical protein